MCKEIDDFNDLKIPTMILSYEKLSEWFKRI